MKERIYLTFVIWTLFSTFRLADASERWTAGFFLWEVVFLANAYILARIIEKWRGR